MIEVGVKDLKNRLSTYLRLVARGERVRVTTRGRPVADIVPAVRAGAADETYTRLVAEGRITPAARSLADRAPRRARGSRSASAEILAEREHGR